MNERAKDILVQLESDHLNTRGDSKITPPRRKQDSPIQLTLFEFSDHPLIEKIKSVDILGLTPLQALQMLEQWQY